MDEAVLTKLALSAMRDLDGLSVDAQVDSDDSFRYKLEVESEDEDDETLRAPSNISVPSASLVLSSRNSSASHLDTLVVSYPCITDLVDTGNLSASELPPIPDPQSTRKHHKSPMPVLQRIDIPPNPSASSSPHSAMLAMPSLSPTSNGPPPSYSARSASATSTVSPSLIDASPCLSPVAAKIICSRRRKKSVDAQRQIPDFTSSETSSSTKKRRPRKNKRKKARRDALKPTSTRSVPRISFDVSNGKVSHFASFGGSLSVDVEASNDRFANRNPFRMRRAKVKFLCRQKGSKAKTMKTSECDATASENENEYAIESENGFVFYSIM